jgi:diaminopimelate decarboxylase
METPYYHFKEKIFLERISAFKKAFLPLDVVIAYPLKANYAPLFCHNILETNICFEAINDSEVSLALSHKIDSSRIVYTAADEHKKPPQVGFVIIGSDTGMSWVPHLCKTINIGIRINPSLKENGSADLFTGEKGTKFGMSIHKAEDAINELLNYRDQIGVHFHLGTQIKDPKQYVKAFHVIEYLLNDLSAKQKLKFIDIGGGYPIAYTKEVPQLENYVSGIFPYLNLIKEKSPQTIIIAEPGRWLAGPSEDLIVSVVDTKITEKKKFIFVDAGYSALFDMSLTGQSYKAVCTKAHSTCEEPDDVIETSVVGPICDTLDVFNLDGDFSDCSIDDEIRIKHTGAYGSVQANNFNLVPPPKIIIEQIGKRKVTISTEDLETGKMKPWKAEITMGEVSVSVAFSNIMTFISFFIIGVILQSRDYVGAGEMALIYIFISALGFLYSAIIYSNASGELSRGDQKDAIKYLTMGNSISEFLGFYPLVVSLPLVAQIYLGNNIISIVIIIIDIFGFAVYHFLDFDIIGRYLPLRHLTKWIIIALTIIFILGNYLIASKDEYILITILITILLFISSLIWFWKKEEFLKKNY